MKHVQLWKNTAVCALLIGLTAVHPIQTQASSDHHEKTTSPVKLNLLNTKGETIGSAELTQKNDAVVVRIVASKLTPGDHGLHFHEIGKCEAPDFKSAGAHFNPASRQHGFNNPKGFHNGDLPNLKADSSGNATAEFETKVVSLKTGDKNSLLKTGGTALIIHDKADDYVTDPSGNSGDRIACGVIQ